ncbi:MAG: TolC family protein [Elusimicrobia bacterium]|nr:TolC family protein [Elusimicrobiota bacterium]
MRRLTAALLLLLAAGAVPVRAASTETVTWSDLVSDALRANPNLAASRFSLESSRAAFYQSFNGVLPQVTLSNSWDESRGAGGLSAAARWQAQASASIKLLDAGEFAAIRSAAASVSLSEADLRKISADERQSLRQSFTHLLFAQRALEVARVIKGLRDRDADMIVLRYNSGTESKGNMMRAQAQALQARMAVVADERDVRAAQRELAQRLGEEDFVDYVATGTFGAPPPPARPADPSGLLPLVPEVLIAQAQERQANAAVAKADSPLWPSLSGSYARSRSDSVEFPSALYGWSAGLTLSYPLFGGGPTSAWYGVKSARRSLDAARAGLASARVQGLQTIESAWAAYADAVDQVRVVEALLAAARQRNDEADIQYASGLLTYDNWEVIASDRISTENQAVTALKNAMDAQTAWDRALGRALGE